MDWDSDKHAVEETSSDATLLGWLDTLQTGLCARCGAKVSLGPGLIFVCTEVVHLPNAEFLYRRTAVCDSCGRRSAAAELIAIADAQ
jgi:hypothetical protein